MTSDRSGATDLKNRDDLGGPDIQAGNAVPPASSTGVAG